MCEDARKRFVEIGPEIRRVFQTDAESEQSPRQVLLALPSRSSVDRGFHATQLVPPMISRSDAMTWSALCASFTSNESIAPKPPICVLARSKPASTPVRVAHAHHVG